MEKYANKSQESDIIAYEIGEDYIDIKFQSGPYVYRYSYDSVTKEDVEEMKKLAISGEGLNTYIDNYCRYMYENKLLIK